MELAGDCRRAAVRDEVDDTLNYKSLSKRLIEFVGDSECQLVETLAEQIAQLVMSEFDVPWIRLKLNKEGALRGASGVGVVIERGQRV